MRAADHPALAGLTVFERGWLSSNNLLVPGADGALLVDTGHINHAPQTLALVRSALVGGRLLRIVNTHLHSDHCGANAMLQRELEAEVLVPAASFPAVADWRAAGLTYDATGQRCERFSAQGAYAAGDVIEAGDGASHCRFEAIEAPGHDPQSMILFDARRGLLLSADALWENGFGVVFPELDGEPGFADVGRVLDLIETLPVRLVVPGHGAPFVDVAAALSRARSRLAAFIAEPRRHARHGAKVLIKYHLMEVGINTRSTLAEWADATQMLRTVWRAYALDEAASAGAWSLELADELVAAGALVRVDGAFVNV